MTYGRFHLLFNLPVLLLLALWIRVWERGWDWIWPFLVVLAIVYVFTIPWDNYAAFHGIWGFPRGQYSLKIGWLPVEEYLFFGIQATQAAGLTIALLEALPVQARGIASFDQTTIIICGAIFSAWVVIGILGRKIGPRSRWHYAWHLLFWFLPVFALLAAIGWPVLGPLWPVWLGTTVLLGGYLTAADLYAIRRGIWFFDPAQITGLKAFRVLPWEEAAFFFLTSALVSWSYLLLLPGHLR